MNVSKDSWFQLGPFSIFDIETTGLSPIYDRIVEIAVVRIDRDGRIDRLTSLINPERPIPFEAYKVHGIDDAMVADSPTFLEIAPKLLSFIEGSTLVAHNARFDLSFLQECLARNGFDIWKGTTIDTIPLIKRAFPNLRSYSLQSLVDIFGLDRGDNRQAHRALYDAEWTLKIFEITMKKLISLYNV